MCCPIKLLSITIMNISIIIIIKIIIIIIIIIIIKLFQLLLPIIIKLFVIVICYSMFHFFPKHSKFQLLQRSVCLNYNQVKPQMFCSFSSVGLERLLQNLKSQI